MPAWSPDGSQLGFVRETGGRRTLAIYDLTPGIQAIINPPTDLGTLAPTAQTRGFQNLWGGLSLAVIPESSGVACSPRCEDAIRANRLIPTVTRSTSDLKIGIFIVKRLGGTRTVLGVKQPRIKVVGRVPLGAAKRAATASRSRSSSSPASTC